MTQAVGCDLIEGSNKIEDRCGVCGGDGSSCKKVTEEKAELTLTGWYSHTYTGVDIPKGARSLKVEELGPTSYVFLGEFFS